MATVTGMKAERMLEIEAASVVDAEVDLEGNITFITKDGTRLERGSVKGPEGPEGPVGSIQASPAGGALQGNYPNPDISDELRDAVPGIASLRTLGTGPEQAAPGNRNLDSGWKTFTPLQGEMPFGAAADNLTARYRKVGPMVYVEVSRALGQDYDLSASTGGNFTNRRVIGDNSVPLVARPKTNHVVGQARCADSPQGCVLTVDGAVIWTGGFPRLYRLGMAFQANFSFMTDN